LWDIRVKNYLTLFTLARLMIRARPTFRLKIDNQGRITIPKEVQEKWDWLAGDTIAVFPYHGEHKLIIFKEEYPELDPQLAKIVDTTGKLPD